MELFILFPNIFIECFRNVVETQKQIFSLFILQYKKKKKTGDHNLACVLELEIIYNSMLYIRFHWKKKYKKTTRNHRFISIIRIWIMFSHVLKMSTSYAPVLCFKRIIQESLLEVWTLKEKNKTKQKNKKKEKRTHKY